MSQPYEDAPAWHKVERVLLDREKDPDFIEKLKAMKPDVIVDLVNYHRRKRRKSWTASAIAGFRIIFTVLPAGRTVWRKRYRLTLTIGKKNRLTTTARDKLASEMYLRNSTVRTAFRRPS